MPTLPPGSSAPGRGWFCIPVTLRPRAWPVSFHGSQGDSALKASPGGGPLAAHEPQVSRPVASAPPSGPRPCTLDLSAALGPGRSGGRLRGE